MKRILVLILAVLLLQFCIGCARIPATEPTVATTVPATEATGISTQPQTQSPTQPTQPTQATTEIPTEPTALTEPTQPTAPTQVSHPTEATLAPTAPVVTTPTQTETPPTSEQTQPQEQPTTMPATTEAGCQHEYQQTFTKAATCTAEGYKKFTCRKCGDVVRQPIPVKEHSYKDATCLTAKICTGCSRTEGTALGHSYGEDHRCIRCGVKDPGVTPESAPVDFSVTVRSDEGVTLRGITVTVTTAAGVSGSAVTDQTGKATIALSAGSSRYTLQLSNVPEGYQVQPSYSFTSDQVTINLKSLPVRSDPNDHSKARYEEGDQMMEFTITDVDGVTYQLSELMKENKLIILDFWYVSCNPCKQEFPHFEAVLEDYGDDVVLLAVDPFYSAEDIRQLRDEMGLSFPVFQDPLGLTDGFRVTSYPTTVFIDSSGKIRRIHRGAFADEAALRKVIELYV